MAKENKYSIRDLKKDYPNDGACLDFLFDTLHTRECSCGGTYNPLFKPMNGKLQGRRQYQCSKCRFQIAPTAGTIFHKSDTPMTLWFHAIFVFSNAKSGISAKQLERELGVTYKTAWRMLSLIRKALTQSTDKLSGDVETDAAYFGGRRSAGGNNKNLGEAVAAKAIVMGAVARGGSMRVKMVNDGTAKTHGDFLEEHIEKEGTRLMTDRSNRYDSVAKGYDRHMVFHRIHEFAKGDVHVNNIESFWAHVKRSIKGTHKVISKKHLQSYLDGFVFHYNNRDNDRERFSALFGMILHA